MDWIKRHLMSSALSAASAIIALQLVVPGVFDFIFDLVLLALIAAVTKLAKPA